MDKYLLPYVLLMIHFYSGAFWLIRINRRLDGAEAKLQWTKFGIYLLLANLIWFCLLYIPSYFPCLGAIVLLFASGEWLRAGRKLRNRLWLLLAFILVAGAFVGFLHMDVKTILHACFVVVLFDGSCQIAGQVAGRRPLLPKISPRKTVEGLMGGAVITLATTLLTRRSFSFQWGELIVLTCFIMASAFLGDLLASAVKRKAKLTTFGKVLPGHGGVLDRFDSLLMAGALLYLLSLVWNLTG